jgi:hypothetical protein
MVIRVRRHPTHFQYLVLALLDALKLDLERIASTLPRASDGVLAGCCMAC